MSYRPYLDARKFAKGLGLRNRMEWKRCVAGKFPDKPKKPADIPVHLIDFT